MSRRRPRLDSGAEATAADEDDVDDAGDQDDLGTSLDDLTLDAQPEQFDRTFEVTKNDVPFATGASPAIPRPWQGISRVAVVYNLNYVYDEDGDQWVRDTGNGSAAEAREVSVPSPPAAPDDTWDTSEVTQATISFNETYQEPPIVLLTVLQAFGDDGNVVVTQTTTSDVTIRAIRLSDSSDPAGDIPVNMAVFRR